jgi:hypothetical protein
MQDDGVCGVGEEALWEREREKKKEKDMITTTNCTDIRSALTPTSSLYHISAGKGKVIFIHLVETEQAWQRRWEEMQWDKCNVVDDKCNIVVHDIPK